MVDELEIRLIEDLREGNPSALKKIYKLYYSRLFFFINAYTHNNEITEELLQDVFLKLWNNRENIYSSQSIVNYIYTIARNHAIDHIRKNRVKIFSIDIIQGKEYSEGNKGEEEVLYSEEEKRINKAINNLSPRKKEVFELHRVENFTYKEIAERLGISVSAVEKNISSAIKELRLKIGIK